MVAPVSDEFLCSSGRTSMDASLGEWGLADGRCANTCNSTRPGAAREAEEKSETRDGLPFTGAGRGGGRWVVHSAFAPTSPLARLIALLPKEHGLCGPHEQHSISLVRRQQLIPTLFSA